MMPSESEHDTAVRRIFDYAEQANLNPTEPERDEDQEDHGFMDLFEIDARDGDSAFVIAPFGELRFGMVYGYDFVATVSNSLSEDEVEQILSDETDEDEDDSYEAAVRVLRQTPEARLERLKRTIHTAGNSEKVATHVRSSNDLTLAEYTHRTNLYPFDDQFGYRSFHESYISLTNVAKRTKEIERGAVRVATPDETDTNQYELLVE